MEKPEITEIDPTSGGINVTYTAPRQCSWEPVEDITAHELAKCLPVVLALIGVDVHSDTETLLDSLPARCYRHFKHNEPDEATSDEEVRRIKTTKYISSHDEMRFRMKDKSGIYLGEKYIGRTIDAVDHFMDEAKDMGLEKVTIDYWENPFEDSGEPDGYFGWENDSKEPIILGAGDES